jgi:hypothetical protein
VDLEELAEDVRTRGLARVFAARGRELVGSPAGRRLISGENLRVLIRADPELRPFTDVPASPDPSGLTLTRRTLVALAAAGLLESNVAVSQAASMTARVPTGARCSTSIEWSFRTGVARSATGRR